jgi:hypothetical protein
MWAFDNGSHCLNLPVPDYDNPKAATMDLGECYEYKQLLKADNTRVAHYERFELDRVEVSSAQNAMSASQESRSTAQGTGQCLPTAGFS